LKVVEMNEDLPALTTQTKLENHAIKDVKVEARFTVKYIFDARISEGLSIPYAVAVDGVAQEIYKNKPKRVSGDNGQIVIPSIKSGASVALYLNSDAHPSYRKNPVYVVKVGERNVVVKVLEKSGKSDATDAPVLTDQKNNEDIRTDVYEALLTGDIWMKIPEERESVRAELPEGSADLVETLLCAKKTEASKNYLLRHMSKFINRTSMDENYVERTQRVKADAALAERLLSAGEAWDVSVEISANRVSITYMPNEACISDRELVRKKGRWMITAIGSACD
jgi:hypothetical protein